MPRAYHVKRFISIYSSNYGQEFVKQEGNLKGIKIRKHNGLQRNPHDPGKVMY